MFFKKRVYFLTTGFNAVYATGQKYISLFSIVAHDSICTKIQPKCHPKTALPVNAFTTVSRDRIHASLCLQGRCCICFLHVTLRIVLYVGTVFFFAAIMSIPLKCWPWFLQIDNVCRFLLFVK